MSEKTTITAETSTSGLTYAKPAEAKAFALGLPVSQVDTYFGNDVEDEAADPTLPAGTPAGNDSE